MAWSLQCSVSCGAGVRRRSITCRSAEGSLLPATACPLQDQPPLTERCVHDDCSPLNDQAWHIGTWGLVSARLPLYLLPGAGPLGLWRAAHVPVLGSDMRYQAPSSHLPPSLPSTSPPPSFVVPFPHPTPTFSVSLPMHVCFLFLLPPTGPSAPRAAARALGGARSSVPLGHPASVGA